MTISKKQFIQWLIDERKAPHNNYGRKGIYAEIIEKAWNLCDTKSEGVVIADLPKGSLVFFPKEAL